MYNYIENKKHLLDKDSNSLCNYSFGIPYQLYKCQNVTKIHLITKYITFKCFWTKNVASRVRCSSSSRRVGPQIPLPHQFISI